MKCNQCGAEVPAGAAFCSQCGTKLGAAAGAADRNPGAARVQSNPRVPGSAPEKDLWNGGYSPKAMIASFVGATLLVIAGAIVAVLTPPPIGWMVVGIGAIVLYAYLGLMLLYRRMSIHYRLTTQRLLRDTGIISRTGDHLLVVNIDDVTVHQTVFDRLFGLGTIRLNTKDTTTPIVTMLGIENPRKVADMIDESRRAERNRRALYTVDA